ncbi:low temperature requirement protein A [Pleomorphomonas oryzae]|uniref:low temperature requirement protein A n=1 Tax=Pleomorphomonas oryzae TaxID=261934 RepID=UPI00040F6411|nr:low temperature requirement protein A [Pleomorphomonas oryzae]
MTSAVQGTDERRVATVELLFDLTFVFAITQITHLLKVAHTPIDILGALAVLTFLWWMYGGYVWLASHIASPRALMLVMLVAMAGTFFLAVGIPGLHEQNTAVVGSAALFVVAVHFVAFATLGGVARSALRFGFVNAGAALLLGVSGYLPLLADGIALALVIVVLVGMALFYSARAFTLSPGHFVERHGLLLLIVFGESVISIGVSLSAGSVVTSLIEAGLSLAVITALWFAYFGGDDRRAERRFSEIAPAERGRVALVSYWFAFLVMIGGVLSLSVALKEHFGPEAEEANFSFWLALGLALYFAGAALFRHGLKLGGSLPRLGAAIAGGLIWLLPLPPVGLLGVVLAIAVAALVTDLPMLRATG